MYNPNSSFPRSNTIAATSSNAGIIAASIRESDEDSDQTLADPHSSSQNGWKKKKRELASLNATFSKKSRG
jgi:hypothetical protein